MIVHIKKKKNLLTAISFLIFTVLVVKLGQKIWNSYCPLQSVLISRSELETNEKLCGVTRRIQLRRQQENSSHLDPGKLIIDELLEIIVDPYLCQAKIKSSFIDGDKDNRERFLVILVESSRANFYERQLIRETWGSVKRHKNWIVETVFLMGQSHHCLSPQNICRRTRLLLQLEEAKLLEEHILFEDILIGAFADTYLNLTYKTLLGYKFVLEKCSRADFIVKVDDDVFLDIPRILDLRDTDIYNSIKLGPKKAPVADIYCRYFTTGKPVRCKYCEFGKYYISEEEWPAEKFPSYCIGGGYAISKDWIDKIYFARGKAGFFRMEDIFVTGISREIAEKEHGAKANIKDISANITMAGHAHEYREDCKGGNLSAFVRNFGVFVFVPREADDFERNMKYLWGKSQEDGKIR